MSETNTPRLTLYQYPNCPFCVRVRDRFDAMNVPYAIVNVSSDRRDPERAEVISKSGCATVPVIHDREGDVWMGESADIIAYAQRQFAPA